MFSFGVRRLQKCIDLTNFLRHLKNRQHKGFSAARNHLSTNTIGILLSLLTQGACYLGLAELCHTLLEYGDSCSNEDVCEHLKHDKNVILNL